MTSRHTLVGALPPAAGTVPECRRAAIAVAHAHPGEWVEYSLGGDDPVTSQAIRSAINRGGGGFDVPGFEFATRGKGTSGERVFFRWNPDHPDLQVNPPLRAVDGRRAG